MTEKDKNFISAVVCLGNEKKYVRAFLEKVTEQLGAHFEKYELIFVNDASRDGSVEAVRAFLKEMENAPPVTMIHMSLHQGLEIAMQAGVDMAVGDFVYEFDSMQMPWPEDLIAKAYEACISGSDIVAVSPRKNRSLFSAVFYRLFNSSSGSKYALRTDVFRVLSRRAVNRIRAVSEATPFRKAAYATCGLRVEHLCYAGDAGKTNETLRAARAADALVVYTNLAFKASLCIAGIMLFLMLAAVVYTMVMYFGMGQNLATGWTTTMLLMTGGFFGVFLILTVVLKYLALLVELVFKKQKYLVESVEKVV